MVAFVDAELLQDGEVCTKAQVVYFCSSKDVAEKGYAFTGCKTEEVED